MYFKYKNAFKYLKCFNTKHKMFICVRRTGSKQRGPYLPKENENKKDWIASMR